MGRTGSFILLDTVLNRICKGAREINIAATLEHIRDQRAKMVKTKVSSAYRVRVGHGISFDYALGSIRIRLRGRCRRSDPFTEGTTAVK